MNVILFRYRVIADDQVKMRSLRCVLIEYDPCPYQKGKFAHEDRCAHEENACKDGGRDWSDVIEIKKHQRLLANHQVKRES